jgi:hypothetical protein
MNKYLISIGFLLLMGCDGNKVEHEELLKLRAEKQKWETERANMQASLDFREGKKEEYRKELNKLKESLANCPTKILEDSSANFSDQKFIKRQSSKKR